MNRLDRDPARDLDTAPSGAARLASRALAAAWRRGKLPFPDLAPTALARAARRAERLDDFGDEQWREPLARLTQSLVSEARLNPLGRALAYGQLVKTLRERLRATALLARQPRILDQAMPAPIVVLGSMRSGTTRIQRLLACDPRLDHTRTFESLDPVRPRAGRLGQIAAVSLGLAALRRLNPAVAAIHPTGARSAEEEFGFFNPSLVSAQFATQWHVPGYARWAAGTDRGEVYGWFRRLLQITAWSRGERTPRPWVLKAPEFMDGLDGLLGAFPDARLVCLRRKASQVVPSAASLIWQHRRLHSDASDPLAAGRDALAMTRRRCEAAAAVRARRGDVAQFELNYVALETDWRREMRRLYDFLGLPLTIAVERRMAAYLAGATAHRRHRYSAAEFGLCHAEIAAALPTGA